MEPQKFSTIDFLIDQTIQKTSFLLFVAPRRRINTISAPAAAQFCGSCSSAFKQFPTCDKAVAVTRRFTSDHAIKAVRVLPELNGSTVTGRPPRFSRCSHCAPEVNASRCQMVRQRPPTGIRSRRMQRGGLRSFLQRNRPRATAPVCGARPSGGSRRIVSGPLRRYT